ncbi:MAG: preprotein translocase subunit SecA [Francisellaceae bacterium]|jgi:preprotein translocase subunit SecA|nr:preprotein translocase subunit SecA [Francisellaceae bacterium]MBT6539251.1 preprotein translocase subunit SecA [Francisellaceae bacterium]
MAIATLIKKVIGSRNDRVLRGHFKIVEAINALEANMSALSADEIPEKINEFKNRVQNKGESLDSILPEAFALTREVAKRTLSMRHFDVQLVGGMVLHEGKVTEMRTGEGKTLIATLPVFLNSLSGNSVHVVTVNDYLAQRDANWMMPIYEMLGMKVGVVIGNMESEAKQEAYSCGVVYGTNNEFGFDYLRDNMAYRPEFRMQKKLSFAIVDEVDSILIDEARTPLIISGADNDSSELYKTINNVMLTLSKQEEEDGPGDYAVDEKQKQVFLTEDGHQTVEKWCLDNNVLTDGESLYDGGNIELMHHIHACLKAHAVFKANVDYLVKDGEVLIVDEHTGRTMDGRRWSDGIHQAVEAKEGVPIKQENQTLASITFQNYFRLYDKLSGMTGTADTEAFELQQIYNLEVVVVPTNKPNKRSDMADLIYLTTEEKYEAIIADIEDCVTRGQPVLVGTISIDNSEKLSNFLNEKNIKHNILNAKHHNREASIIANAGHPGNVTIATNMAGRGTDIVLGGNISAMLDGKDDNEKEQLTANWQELHQQVLNAGGLRIIGTERHESRRIDNQLRGRSGRQGDPGSSQFYLSLEDNLMRIFVSESIAGVLGKLSTERGEAITHNWISKAVENAQRKVEGHNFDIRKQLLDLDNVANEQRQVIYQQRNELMDVGDIMTTIKSMRSDIVRTTVSEHIPPNSIEERWNIPALMTDLEVLYGDKIDITSWLKKDPNITEDVITEKIVEIFANLYLEKENMIGPENMRQMEKVIMLKVIDNFWKEHLATMDHLRQSIYLRGYAQKDPKQEFKRESFLLFTDMLENIKREVIAILNKITLREEEDVGGLEERMREKEKVELEFHHDEAQNDSEQKQLSEQSDEKNTVQTYTREQAKVGRNEACPCKSGKKYKHCHGRIA